MLVFSREEAKPDWRTVRCMTAFLFRVKSVPAALYKALGGFATNGVNIVKLESYLSGAHFEQAQFYAEVEGHPEQRGLQLALEELAFLLRRIEDAGHLPDQSFPPQGLGSADPAWDLIGDLKGPDPCRRSPSASRRRSCRADFAALGAEVEAIDGRRRRLDPCRRDGQPLRAQPDDRADGGEGAAQAQQAAVRRASDGDAGRSAGAGLRRCRRRHDLVPSRGGPARPSHDPAHQEPRQAGGHGAQSGDAARHGRARAGRSRPGAGDERQSGLRRPGLHRKPARQDRRPAQGDRCAGQADRSRGRWRRQSGDRQTLHQGRRRCPGRRHRRVQRRRRSYAANIKALRT